MEPFIFFFTLFVLFQIPFYLFIRNRMWKKCSFYLSKIGHDMQGELFSLICAAELLEKTTLEQSQKDHIAFILESGKTSLKRLKFKTPIFEDTPTYKPFLVKKKIHETIDLFRIPAKEKKIFLKCDIDQELPEMITGCSVRFTQILINLMHNALHCTEKGSIHIKASKKKGSLHIEIIDTGKERDSFFEEGLGFYILKRLVKKEGGNMGVVSIPYQGSSFWITLPWIINQDDKKVTRSLLRL